MKVEASLLSCSIIVILINSSLLSNAQIQQAKQVEVLDSRVVSQDQVSVAHTDMRNGIHKRSFRELKCFGFMAPLESKRLDFFSRVNEEGV